MFTRIAWGAATAIALAAYANAAFAADATPRPAPVVARPVVVAPPSWNGLYIGGNLGWGWARWSGELVYDAGLGPGVPQPFDPTHRTITGNGWLGGGQVGFNHQAGGLVVGLEADIDWTGIKKTETFAATGISTGYFWTIENHLDWFSTVRGRLGLAAGNTLFYVTGGGAFGQASSHETVTADQRQGFPAPGTVTAIASVSENHIGWTAGVGAEHKFGPHWSAKIEYLFVDLGSAQYRYRGTAYPANATPCAMGPFGALVTYGAGPYGPAGPTCSFPHTTDAFPARLTVQTIRLGVNYLF